MCRLCFSFDNYNPQLSQVTHAADDDAADQYLSRKRKAVIFKESLASTLLCWSKILQLKPSENRWMKDIWSWSGGGYTCWLSILLLILHVVGAHAPGKVPGEPTICVYVSMYYRVCTCACVCILVY